MKLALVDAELRSYRQETVTAGLAHAAQAVALGPAVMMPATTSLRDRAGRSDAGGIDRERW
jgi:hypothetical protein